MEENMNLIELSELLLDEKKAEEYLLNVGILKTFTLCEKCGSSKLGRIRRGRCKCYGCKAEWSLRKNSILEGQSISYSKFLGLVKLFELEFTATQTSVELGSNLNTTKKLFNEIRLSLTQINEEKFNKLDKILAGNNTRISINIKNDKIHLELANHDITGSELLKIKRTRVPNREVSYLFNISKMDAKTIDRKINSFPIQINYFWRFARSRLNNYRGTKLNYLFLYLKEIEFRYNHKNNNLYHKIIKNLSNY
jgi:transposase